MLFCEASFGHESLTAFSNHLVLKEGARIVRSRSTVSMSTKKNLKTQEKEIVTRVYNRMKFEAQYGYVQKLTDARWRTSQAVGYSESTISRVLREERIGKKSDGPKTEKVFKNPSKRKRHRPQCNLEELDIPYLRRTMMTYHANFKEPPTLRRLKQMMAERINFSGCIESMRSIFRAIGFEFTSLGVGKNRILSEKHEMQWWRYQFLNQLKKFREEGRYVVYTDECCIHVNTAKAKGRLMVVHAGGKEGFIPNAALVFKGTSTSGDYHDNLSYEDYKTWLTTQLLPNVPKNSVIVLDDVALHNVLSEKPPGPDADKKTMKTWLNEKNVPFEENITKIELYDLIFQNKDKYKSYEIDQLIRSQGCEILRLPSHHSELNAIEKIWVVLKENVASKNSEMDLNANIDLIKEELGNIDKNTWEHACLIVENTEKQFAQLFDLDIDSIVDFNDDQQVDGSDSNDNMSE